MVKNIIRYGVVALLLVVLIGGSVYILARPSDVAANQSGWQTGTARQARSTAPQIETAGGNGSVGNNLGGGQGQGSRSQLNDSGSGYRQGGNGQGNASDLCTEDCAASPGAQGQGQGFQGQGQGVGQGSQGQGLGQGSQDQAGVRSPYLNAAQDWQTVQGVVSAVDGDVFIETDTGELLVGMGQSWYRDEAGFSIAVGDELLVRGYMEDGEFKAGDVENLTTGDTISLRDESGRPMWSGRGNLKNRG